MPINETDPRSNVIFICKTSEKKVMVRLPKRISFAKRKQVSSSVEGQNFTRKPIPWKVKKAQFKQQEESTLRSYLCSDFQQKMPLKNPAKSSERIGPGYLETARGPGSSGRVTQLMWDWDSSREVPRNTRNEEQICPSQVPSGAAKNQKV